MTGGNVSTIYCPNDEMKNIQSYSRYNLLIEAVNVIRDYAIFMLDSHGTILTWNLGAERIYGYQENEIVGKNFSQFYIVDERNRNRPLNDLEQAFKNGTREIEGWRVRRTGETFWANVVITQVLNEKEEFLGFSVVIRDLTEKRKHLEELRESEDRFKLLVSGVKDYAIFILDLNGYVKSWNEGAQHLKGYTSDEIIGRHFSTFYLTEDLFAGKCESELKVALATGRFEDEGWRVRKDGTCFWANVLIASFRNSKGEVIGFSKITRDLTERKRADDRLKQANEELEHRVKSRTEELLASKESLERALQVRDEFLSIASHELKTPLTSLKIQVQLLQKKAGRLFENIEMNSDFKCALETIERQTNRLNALIDDLLCVSQVQAGKLQFNFSLTPISRLLEESITYWSDAMSALGCEIHTDIAPNVVGILDSFRVEQVLANLFSNVIKYAPGKPVLISLQQSGDSAVIRVKDSGSGIDKAKQNKIFERFERAVKSSVTSGMGLGLYISKSIVEMHGGKISLESEIGKGSEFIVELPLVKVSV